MERMDKGDLLHIGTTYIEVHTFKGQDYVTARDFNTTTNALSKEILELEEENKKLKDEIGHLEFDIEAWKKLKAVWEKKEQKLQIEIGGLMGERDGLKMVVEKLKEENQTLELWLDNKEKLNEEYRKQIDKYKRQYEHSMGFMEEDTLQELKDIGELGDDELIYEEGLYD